MAKGSVSPARPSLVRQRPAGRSMYTPRPRSSPSSCSACSHAPVPPHCSWTRCSTIRRICSVSKPAKAPASPASATGTSALPCASAAAAEAASSGSASTEKGSMPPLRPSAVCHTREATSMTRPALCSTSASSCCSCAAADCWPLADSCSTMSTTCIMCSIGSSCGSACALPGGAACSVPLGSLGTAGGSAAALATSYVKGSMHPPRDPSTVRHMRELMSTTKPTSETKRSACACCPPRSRLRRCSMIARMRCS
mmetsp:Transcript_28317/g.66254  ORF Transcript_28317/g.66254 Transcript_28317/m.66254 type:complete len:254 (-) Transcript_28317:126-887(-)